MPREFRYHLNENGISSFTVISHPDGSFYFTQYFSVRGRTCLTTKQEASERPYIKDEDPEHTKSHSTEGRETQTKHQHTKFSGRPEDLERMVRARLVCATGKAALKEETVKDILKKYRADYPALKYSSDTADNPKKAKNKSKSKSSSSARVYTSLPSYPSPEGSFPSIYEHHQCVSLTDQPCPYNTNSQSFALPSSPLSEFASSPQVISAATVIAGFGLLAWLYKKGVGNCFNRKSTTESKPVGENRKLRR